MTETAASAVPAFAELPRIEQLDMPHAWEVFGAGDELGTINQLTPERIRRAATLVHDGAVVNLSLPLTEPSPPFIGRTPFRHELSYLDRNTLDDRLDGYDLQSSTHWDGLRHVSAGKAGFYGGVHEEPRPGGGPLGIERWAEHGLVGRGVLLDIARHLAGSGEAYEALAGNQVSVEVVRACAADQGVALAAGDVLCLRFGWTGAYRALDDDGRQRYAEGLPPFVGRGPGHPPWAGLAAGEEMAAYLWDAQVAAVAADNPAVESSPGTQGQYLHRRLIPLLGFALGEMFDFERLAELCAADGRYEFLFVSVPLNLPGGVASPANAIAIR